MPSPPCIHYIAAVILFVLLAIVSWVCTDNTLKYLPQDCNPAKYRTAYRIIAGAMILFPAVGYAVALLLGARSNKVFFMEAAGILTFGVYWLVKTYELKLSSLERDPVGAVRYARPLLRGDVQVEDEKQD